MDNLLNQKFDSDEDDEDYVPETDPKNDIQKTMKNSNKNETLEDLKHIK